MQRIFELKPSRLHCSALFLACRSDFDLRDSKERRRLHHGRPVLPQVKSGKAPDAVGKAVPAIVQLFAPRYVATALLEGI